MHPRAKLTRAEPLNPRRVTFERLTPVPQLVQLDDFTTAIGL